MQVDREKFEKIVGNMLRTQPIKRSEAKIGKPAPTPKPQK
jgi:hypothetical protein